VPIGKQEPLLNPVVGAETTASVGVPQLSVTTGVDQVAIAQVVPVAVSTERLLGQKSNTGGMVSLAQSFGLGVTMTSKLHVAVRPFTRASWAVYVIVVLPTGKQLLPDVLLGEFAISTRGKDVTVIFGV
jgi:hypothetical protein